jgi:DHA1 family bicyclomycin/chloramphenicol resistance-like MFS transporter
MSWALGGGRGQFAGHDRALVSAALLLVAAFTGWGERWTVLPLIFLVLSSYGFMAGNTMAGALNG